MKKPEKPSARARKLRAKLARGSAISNDDREWLEAYVPVPFGSGRPKKVQQSEPEKVPDDGGADLGSSPGVPDTAPPSADPTPPPPLEAPPKVAEEPKAAPSSSGPDWRDKYRKRGMADGREMLCTFIGERHQEALVALVDDLKLAKIDPWLDPTDFGGLFILAWDEILPPNFKITPRIAAAAMTTTVVGQRWWNHKKVVAAQKDDPDIQAWKRKQQEKEDADRAAKAKPADPAPQFAAPPQNAAPAPDINGMPRVDPEPTVKKPFDPELLI